MASLGIRCGGNFGLLGRRYDGCDHIIQKVVGGGPRSSLVVSTGRLGKSRSLISVSEMKKLQAVNNRRKGNEVVSRDKLDEWMKESVVDIVKNLQAAPLFLRFYATEDGEAARFETEKAVEEERWAVLEKQWKSGAAPTPEGIIFVQKLEEEGEEEENGDYEGESKAWGIVVQGKCGGRGGAQACYLLKTSRAAAGMGLWCTHFSLVRVKNFRETTKSQLQNCWLLQNQ